jgi:hypothetical protein
MPEEIARASMIVGVVRGPLREMRSRTFVAPLLHSALVHMGKSFHSQDAADHQSVSISVISGSLPGYRSIFQTRLKNQRVVFEPNLYVRTTNLVIVVLLTTKQQIKPIESDGERESFNLLDILALLPRQTISLQTSPGSLLGIAPHLLRDKMRGCERRSQQTSFKLIYLKTRLVEPIGTLEKESGIVSGLAFLERLSSVTR